MLSTATLRIVVPEKSRPTFHYNFTFKMIQNVISRQIKIMVLEKSRPTYHYRFTFIMIKKVIFRQIITIDLL